MIKLVNLPSLSYMLETGKIYNRSAKSRNFTEVCIVEGKFCALHQKLKKKTVEGSICEKQEKYFKAKVAIFTVQSLILNQYPVDLLTFLELYLKSSKYLKLGKFGLVGAICQSSFVRVRSI